MTRALGTAQTRPRLAHTQWRSAPSDASRKSDTRGSCRFCYRRICSRRPQPAGLQAGPLHLGCRHGARLRPLQRGRQVTSSYGPRKHRARSRSTRMVEEGRRRAFPRLVPRLAVRGGPVRPSSRSFGRARVGAVGALTRWSVFSRCQNAAKRTRNGQ